MTDTPSDFEAQTREQLDEILCKFADYIKHHEKTGLGGPNHQIVTKAAILDWHEAAVREAEAVAVNEARIEERQYAFRLVSDLRYQNINLDFAREVTLERLTDSQVEAQLRQQHNSKGMGDV